MKTLVREEKQAATGNINNPHPILIAGPCSAENPEMIMQVAQSLKEVPLSYLRAGIWKPRTRPNQFEGVGSRGLPWLLEAKREYGVKIATEVANLKHVYEALKHNVDMVWIGARTTSNPFAVQEIAEALKGVNIPVWVKNPLNPDLKLWMGALERFEKSGVSELGAIHRGFSVYGNHQYRNPPNWQIPIDLKREIPGLPIIVDPSHIGGKRGYIKEISQMAMDLAFNGLMIEVHPSPEDALSDASQQITPTRFKELLGELRYPDNRSNDAQVQLSLDSLRNEIDSLDHQVISLFETRMKIARDIGKYKQENNITILQNTRWETVIKKVVDLGMQKSLSKKFTERIFKAVHQESIRHQADIIQSQKESRKSS